MSDTRLDIKRSSFAEFLTREDVRAIIFNNILNNSSGTFSRIFNNLPPQNTVYEYLRSTLELCKFNANISNNNSDLDEVVESIPASIKLEIEAWVDLVYATAMFDLLDNQGNIRADILEALKDFDLKRYSPEEIKTGLFSGYLLMVGQHQPLLIFDIDDEKNTRKNNYINYAFGALEKRRAQDLKSQITISSDFSKKTRLALYDALQKEDELSFRFVFEAEKLLYSSNQEYCEYLRSVYENKCREFNSHLLQLAQDERTIEHTAKLQVLAQVEKIYVESKDDVFLLQVTKLRMLTETLKQTEAYTPQADTPTKAKYDSLTADLSKQDWAEPLASVMPLVPIAAVTAGLIATCIIFSLATGGVAIPFLAPALAAFSYSALLGTSIVTGVGAAAGLSVSIYSMWHQLTQTNLVEKMKVVRGKDEVDDQASDSEAISLSKM